MEEILFSLTVDSNNNIYACGYTLGSFNGQTLNGNKDIWVIKLDLNGTTKFTKYFID